MFDFFRRWREEAPPHSAPVKTEGEVDVLLTKEATNGAGPAPAVVLGSVGKTPAHKKIRWWIQNPPDAPMRLRITPELCDEMLEYNDANRPLSPGAVKKYARQMAAGQWRVTSDLIVFSDKGRLINGQHRLHAAKLAGVSFDAWVKFGDPDENFAFMDVGKPRGASDVFAINGVKNWAMMASAARWVMAYDMDVMSGGRSGLSFSPTPAEVYEYFCKIPRLADSAAAGRIFAENRLAQPSMMAALHFMCSRKSRTQADEFFQKIGGIGIGSKSDPAYKLHKRLVENVAKSEALKPIVVAAYTVKTWNAFRTGQPLGVLRWRGEQNPQEPFPKVQ
jgi:hypothetical protein